MRNARHGERGQVLPLWIGAIITTLMFGFLAVNYGNTLRYQIRAQNTADSVAQAMMALQAQRYNQMTVALYGTAVEEYRIRHLLDGVLLAANDSGGCQDSYQSYQSIAGNVTFDPGTCAQIYHDTAQEYIAAFNRYTTDVTLLNDYSTRTSYANWVTDTTSLRNHLTSSTHCNSDAPTTVQPDGTDCFFKISIVGQAKRTGLLAVQQDAQDILVPGLGKVSTIANDLENSNLFAPAQIDVTACAKIPPVIPNFGPMSLKPQYAIGRAAATTVMIEEDWMQPGAIVDPAGRPANTFFQPYEQYSDYVTGTDYNTSSANTETYNWYGVDFGGNAAVAYVNYGVFSQPTYNNEFSVRLGWWNAIAMKPFATTPAIGTICP